jgi:hypothetical protein
LFDYDLKKPVDNNKPKGSQDTKGGVMSEVVRLYRYKSLLSSRKGAHAQGLDQNHQRQGGGAQTGGLENQQVAEVEPSYPAFVVHWTDCSAGRGTPLDREVRTAPTETLMEEIAVKMVEDNIKKGWEEVA